MIPMNRTPPLFAHARSRLRDWRWIFALVLSSATGGINAQVLDEVGMAPDGETVTIDIRLLAQINFQRYVVTPSGSVAQLYFTVTVAEDSVQGVVEESRTVPASDTLPAFDVRFVSDLHGTQRHVDLDFRKPVEIVRAGLGHDNRSLHVVLKKEPRVEGAAAAPPAAPVVIASDPNVALQTARTALEAGRNEECVAILNQILNLPPNAATRDAQELIGNAREALGEIARARAEYNLYLKLYPDGPGVARVKARLEIIASVPSGEAPRGTKAARAPQWLRWGSISQSYYGGQSRIRNETTIYTPATDSTVIDVQSLSNTDQSALVSNVDATARYRSAEWDNRFVFRDVSSLSFLNGVPSQNRLSAMYADLRNETIQAGARIGRQSSTGNGVLGRYDGANVSWNFRPHWKAILLAGTPAESTLGQRKYFGGGALEAEGLIEGLSTGIYGITQRTEGLEDRSAVGTEVRYFTPSLSVFSVLDYDVAFNTLNIGSIQGSWTRSGGGTVNFLYDYRRGPTLQLGNALLGETATSLARLRDTMSLDDIRRQALGLSPASRVLLLGTTYPVTTRWQLGIEGRLSSIGGTIATATLPATAGTGDVYTLTLQAIGTGLWLPSSVVVMSGSRLTSRDYDAWLFSVNSRFNFGTHWRVEPGLRWYSQNNLTGTSLRRLSPTVRTIYGFSDRASLESEFTLEQSNSKSAQINETSSLVLYYLGYRLSF